MAKNPVALIIPCHRVLAAGNKIGGFSAPGGSVEGKDAGIGGREARAAEAGAAVVVLRGGG